VCLLTPATMVSSWTENTLEQPKIQARLIDLGVEIVTAHAIEQVSSDMLHIEDIYCGKMKRTLPFDTLILVTSRQSDDDLYQSLLDGPHDFESLQLIGDAKAPGTIAAAVYEGHSAARYFEVEQDEYAPLFQREIPAIN
ncbi:MAG: NADH:flavin oxidoreductase, partial [Pseudomonadota bacterium]